MNLCYLLGNLLHEKTHLLSIKLWYGNHQDSNFADKGPEALRVWKTSQGHNPKRGQN